MDAKKTIVACTILSWQFKLAHDRKLVPVVEYVVFQDMLHRTVAELQEQLKQ